MSFTSVWWGWSRRHRLEHNKSDQVAANRCEVPGFWREISVSESIPLTSRCSSTMKLFFQLWEQTHRHDKDSSTPISAPELSRTSLAQQARETRSQYSHVYDRILILIDIGVRGVVQGGVSHTTRCLFSKRSRYNFLDSILWWCPFHSSYCIAQHVHHARSMRHSADCQTCNRCQHHRPDLNESLVSTRRSQHHRDSQLTKWWIWTHHSQSHMNDPNFPTLLLGRLVDFVKSGVWSRQKVKRMFGTTISVVDSAWQVNNEEAMCECHEEKASFGIRSSVSCTPDSRRDQFCLQSWCVPYIHSSHNGLLDDVVRKVFALLSKRVQVWKSSGILHISNSSSLVDVCSWSCFGRNVYGSSASVLFCCAICCWSQRRVEARARLVAGCCLLSYLRCIISRARCPVGRIAQGR